ncbi:hypothetical protein A9K55_008300 [Cordyceps militaris]|uniref:Uncharacterized protein n=1 Tax=Cordyceps militaris TaxID=73501 RepID=A0A2H4SET2_CORMI|nr:hypothetical protein A9K55_008300 [Cordyceps militaris]
MIGTSLRPAVGAHLGMVIGSNDALPVSPKMLKRGEGAGKVAQPVVTYVDWIDATYSMWDAEVSVEPAQLHPDLTDYTTGLRLMAIHRLEMNWKPVSVSVACTSVIVGVNWC